MSQPLEFNPGRGEAEVQLEVAKNRLSNAQMDLDTAREDGKPESQIETLKGLVDQYQRDLDNLQKDIEQKGMGAVA